MAAGQEPIEDWEGLYRRIPAKPKYFRPGASPSPLSFRPGPDDQTGLSVYRARYASPEQVAAAGVGESYYVAVLKAGDLRERSLHLVPKPEPDSPGHAEIADLTYTNRREDRAEELQVLLALRLCCEILGPFPGQGAKECRP